MFDCGAPSSIWLKIAIILILSHGVTLASDDGETDAEGNPLLFEAEDEGQKCSYFYNERSPTNEGGLVNCTWYKTKACCKRTEVTSVFAAMDPLYGATKLCRNYINYLMCFFCSPDQGKFYKSNKVNVCLDYCESLYEECKNAGFSNMLIGEAYANGTSFCEAQNFEVVENADCFKFDPNVFGSSVKMVPLSILIIFMISVFAREINIF
ncbi:hypothetical protein EGW08_018293 [Elysia chlorotica]|uniref:Folate receptor-like domain-containing protein n=1 Tax=Elysia chlorotica TaxID=188477 RepID=A0A433SXA2_ELYCH|nr:hypothetical protein EGW08_018293 [Elysia chlorotica]